MEINLVFKRLFNRRWWWTTLLVIVGMIILVRLGFWQLDRRDQRLAYNGMVVERWKQEPYNLNSSSLPDDLSELNFRRVQIEGEFDYNNEILLKNQTVNGSPGVILVTPLVYKQGQAVLVSRGWVPQRASSPEEAAQFVEPEHVPVIGVVHESELLPSGEAPPVPTSSRREWFRIYIDAIQPQMPYTLMPVFIEQMPEEGRSANALPFREEPWRQLKDPGMHLSYAIQWFLFSVIFGFGYIQFVRYTELREQRVAAENLAAEQDSVLDIEPLPEKF